MVPLVYHPRYNITAFGMEKLHPFDGTKYQRIHDWLIRQSLRSSEQFQVPHPCSRADLLRVHTPEYLDSLRETATLVRILAVPVVGMLPASLIDWRVLEPMRWATGGTILACRLARAHGLALNLGGGYHHAGPNASSGFCVYADTPMALAALHADAPFRSVLVIDTDAHQGNGTANALRPWPWAHMLDLFEEDIFPWPKASEDMPVPLASDITGAEYLDVLARHLDSRWIAASPSLLSTTRAPTCSPPTR
jgi:histone deacetylase 11